LVWSAQKQIWAVLRRGDSRQRLSYSLAATFLGRMCLSGDVNELGAAEWRFVKEAVAFHREVAPLIRDGTFRCVRAASKSWQQVTGHQIVTMQSRGGGELLVVWHRFGGDSPRLELELPRGEKWTVVREWSDTTGLVTLRENRLTWPKVAEWTGGVVLLRAVSLRG
jgi:alpha-galactosidase